MEPEKVLRANVAKSLVKATIAMAILTPFLELSWAHIPNYLLFLGAYYLFVGVYMLNKEGTEYRVGESGISIKRLWRKELTVTYGNIQGLGFSQGMLARRFKCGTVYIELKQGKGTHKSLAGVSVMQLRDLPDPTELMSQISDSLGPYAAAPAGESPQTSSA
ncbi:MAG: PH domain-containing protein [Nitrososphaerota archaeon]|nr:PH domain-containing protein [Nitrososphaerota archaeon]